MNPKLKSALQIVLFTLIGAGFVWLSVRNIPDREIVTTKQSFKNADYFFVAISILFSLLAHIIRAWRWNSLLQPLGHSISFKNSFAAVMIGYVVGYVLPRGGGELSRCGVATRYEKIPFTASLGTVITERIIDVLMLFVIFFIALAVQYKELIGMTNKYVLNPLSRKLFLNQTALYIIISLIVFFFIMLLVFRKKIKNIFKGKVGNILKNFGTGLSSVKDVKNPRLFIIQSVLIWMCYFLSLYVCFWCFGETKDLGLKPALLILLFGTIGVIVTPGGIGLYQIIATQILLFYGVVNSVSISFPWIIWGSQFFSIIVIGGLCFLFLPIINRDKKIEAIPENR
ncbi:MAG: lysylphosphatidylglycerol synthase transmembrane domain-containing protein [Chitinophagaceae bacterium]